LEYVAFVQHKVLLLPLCPLALLLLLLLLLLNLLLNLGRPRVVGLVVAVVCEAVLFIEKLLLCKILSGEDCSAKIEVDQGVSLKIAPRLLFYSFSCCLFESSAGG
jgi:hypothetical protein